MWSYKRDGWFPALTGITEDSFKARINQGKTEHPENASRIRAEKNYQPEECNLTLLSAIFVLIFAIVSLNNNLGSDWKY